MFSWAYNDWNLPLNPPYQIKIVKDLTGIEAEKSCDIQ